MVAFRNWISVALAISGGTVLGYSVPATVSSIVKRGRADIVKEILKAIGVFTDDTVYTWDFNKFPQYCDLYLETNNGGHCYATIECKKDGKKFYEEKTWNDCSVGGSSAFDDPRIGAWGVTWRTRDGFEGEGLTEPLLSTWEIDPNNLFGGGPMKEWDVTALAIQYEKATRCGKGIAPLKCDNGPFICRFVTGNENIQDSRKKKWSCGIPIKGEKSLDTLELPKLNG
ncbi:hypothetical protein IQ06DRAFT_354172 [Phaeosphaeriaceae sp. SRC1lsM3a]|nr:hypothetical protein IQ06DRAFT_354172 [Stagonospora sp. SRC1lsM3a]